MTILNNALLAAAGAGESAAQERLLDLMAPVLDTAARRTLNRQYPAWVLDDARQVAQLACVIWADGCRDTVALPAFLGTVARRECLRERCYYADGWVLPIRAATGAATLDPEEHEEGFATVPSAEEEVIRMAEVARLRDAVATLPPALCETITRRCGLDGQPPATLRHLAAEMNIAFTSVVGRERRALGLLREKLA